MRRRTIRPRVVVALVAALLTFSVFSSSAATLGGLQSDHLGAASGHTRRLPGVQLEWNPDDPSLRAASVRVTAAKNKKFRNRDVVDVTAVGSDGATCSETTVVSGRTTTVDLPLTSCPLALWELQQVAVNVSGSGKARQFRGDLGQLRGTLAAFDGPVAGTDVTAQHTTVKRGGTEVVDTLRLQVPAATPDELVGSRMVTATSARGDTVTHAGTIGTSAQNQGIWAQPDPETSVTTVVVDMARVAQAAPAVADVEEYRLVLLRPQRLGAGQASETADAVSTATGVVDHVIPEVGTALEPVGLDDRLSFSGGSAQQDEVSLRYCYDFEVTNTSSESVEWEVTFDTTKPPMWGLDPTVVDKKGVGTLHSKWNFEDRDYDADTGLWSVGGVSWNRVLSPGQSRTVGYCARPDVPELDTSRFDEPIVTVEPSSGRYYVAFRVSVTSSFDFLVPWEAEVDFADHVCPASIGDGIKGQNAVLTHIEGTRYKVRGTDNSFRFVSKDTAQDYVFANFKPISDPFDPACG